MDELTEDLEPATSFRATELDCYHLTRQRLLATFGQCANMNFFAFPLHIDGNVRNWIRLYAAAIRCSVQPCNGGWVFLDWYYKLEDSEDSWTHATAVYFDLPTGRQVFFDPSGCLLRTEVGNVNSFFERHHVWVPDRLANVSLCGGHLIAGVLRCRSTAAVTCFNSIPFRVTSETHC
jgi:hypothetical protein